MIQEIITFLIVGTAVVYALSGLLKKPHRRQKSVAKTDFKKESFAMQHNCSGCSADCMMRNTVKPLNGTNANLCKQIETNIFAQKHKNR
jgi:hypothetical protein